MREQGESARSGSSSVPFHEEVEAARKERGLTQAEVARAAGMSIRAYSNFANGHLKSGLQPKNRRAIREAVGLDVVPQPPISLEDEELPADVKQFRNFVTAYLMTMSPEDRDRFMGAETRRWLGLRTGQSQ